MSIKKTGVDQQLIRDLAGILNDTNLTEIEVELGDLKVRVSRQSQAVHAVAAPLPAIAEPEGGGVPNVGHDCAPVDLSMNAPSIGIGRLRDKPS